MFKLLVGIDSISRCLEIYRRKEVKNGQTYNTIKYMITKRGLANVLQRAHNDASFADYFSLIMELWSIYKQYTSDHRAARAEREVESISDRCDRILEAIRVNTEKLETALAEPHTMKVSSTTKLDKILGHVSYIANDYYKMKNCAIEAGVLSTMNPVNPELRHGFAIATKVFNGEYMLDLISGQRRYVIRTLEAKLDTEDYEEHAPFTFFANPIDF